MIATAGVLDVLEVRNLLASVLREARFAFALPCGSPFGTVTESSAPAG